MQKEIFESPEVFEAYARIDCNYYLLSEIYKRMGIVRPPIERMIDVATGFAEMEISKMKKTATEIIESIIKDKKFIGAETVKDEEVLNKLKNI
jgi:hypothetical protein